MNKSISMFGLGEYKDLTSHTTWWDGFNPGLQHWLARESIPLSAIYTPDLQDKDEIRDNLIVWVTDINKTLNSVTL